MRVAVLTSSRADFGIYLPLIKKLKTDPFFELELVVFGTHLSHFHGYTLSQIHSEGFEPFVTIESIGNRDSPKAIADAMAVTSTRFTDYWAEAKGRIQIAFCLGDRFEMFAAVSASVPFNIILAHIHGGETTEGAIDDAFRHSITHMAQYHFTSSEEHARRVSQLKCSQDNVYNVGALSLDNLHEIEFYSDSDFNSQFGTIVDSKTILVTLHPETKGQNNAEEHAQIVSEVLKNEPLYNVIITMPNADTKGNKIREVFKSLVENIPSRIKLIENFGTKGYFTAISRCAFLFGNSSSGIIEAASFGKYVINIGGRQKGRPTGPNVVHVPFDKKELSHAIRKIEKLPKITKENIYFQGGAAQSIVEILKKIKI